MEKTKILPKTIKVELTRRELFVLINSKKNEIIDACEIIKSYSSIKDVILDSKQIGVMGKELNKLIELFDGVSE